MNGFNTFYINKSGKMDNLISLQEGVSRLAMKEGGYLWIDFYSPTKENLMILSEPFGIHRLSLEACLDENQIPRINEFDKYVHILFNTFLYSEKDVIINEADLFLGKNFLITVNKAGEKNSELSKIFQSLITQEKHTTRLGPSYALHVVLDYIVDQKFIAIESVGDDLVALEEIMTKNHKDFDHLKLQRLRHSLIDFRKSLFHEREILIKIYRGDIDLIPDKAIIHYTDIYDHISKFFELTEIYREMVTNLIQTNLAMLNNDIASAANRTNASVKRLTLITTIFMPLSLLAGIGGMSEWSMITGPSNWKIAYPAFLGIITAIGVLSYFLLRWLQKKD